MRPQSLLGVRYLAAALAAATLALLCWASGAAAATYTFTAVADARAEAISPNSNFGGSSDLNADLSPQRESFVKFAVAGIPAGERVQSATLRVYNSDSSSDGPAVYGTSSSWTETGLTWNARPARDASATADVRTIAAGATISYPVTTKVTGNGTFSFAFVGTSTDGVDYRSREYSAGRRPVLEVVTEAAPTSTPTPSPTPEPTSFMRTVWTPSDSTTFSTVKSLGFQSVLVNPDRAQLDRAWGAGLRAGVWLGNYDDVNCRWNWSDSTVSTRINAVKGHPAIAYYFVADEPHAAPSGGCLSSPQDLTARNALVKSLDASVPTLITENRREDFAAVGRIADVFGPIRYPCSYSSGCVPSKVTETITAVNAAGITNWWGVVQTFREPSGGYYRAPNASELQQIIAAWKSDPGIDGLMAYAWGESCCGDDIGLRDLTDLWGVWQAENGTF
jgi:hypothetical protein